jgi:hypothetical protein
LADVKMPTPELHMLCKKTWPLHGPQRATSVPVLPAFDRKLGLKLVINIWIICGGNDTIK